MPREASGGGGGGQVGTACAVLLGIRGKYLYRRSGGEGGTKLPLASLGHGDDGDGGMVRCGHSQPLLGCLPKARTRREGIIVLLYLFLVY
jgi:hypothetical protein